MNTERQLAIVGMSCAGCVGRVERALRAVPGVESAEVSLATERARVIGPAMRPSDLIAAVAGTGFSAELLTGDAHNDAERDRDAARRARRALHMVFGAALFSAPLLLPMLGVPLPGWLQLALATPVQFGAGWVFYRNAFKAVRGGGANMDLLVALGTSAAYLFGLGRVLAGLGGPYSFDSGAVVITLVLLGRWLEGRTRRAAASAIRDLTALQPQRACVERDGRTFDLPIQALTQGDVVVVRPGDAIPADGEVLSGDSTCDESLLTGESLPVDKAPGDRAIGGAINGNGLLRVRVIATGADSTLARIIALVESAQAGKAPIQRLVDRVAAVFVPVVMLCAAVAFAGWWLAGAPQHGLMAAVSVLVVACPCALGLATPAAIVAGVGAAARAGILVRDPDALEAARGVDLAVLDKTGTLTLGRPAVVEVVPVAGDEATLLRLAASAEQGSEHPVGRAVLAHALRTETGNALSPVQAFRAFPGGGLLATLPEGRILIGTPALMEAHAVPLVLDGRSAALEDAGCTVLRVARLEPMPEMLGLVAVRDQMRDNAGRAVRRLAEAGLGTVLLTGDNERAAQAVARVAGIDRVVAGQLPQGKAEAVRRLRQQGYRVAMLGDGLNDAPALAEACLGVAMGGGSGAAIGAAGVTLMRDDPGGLADVVAIGRATGRTIRQNLAWAFLFNLLGLPLAMAGRIEPMVAGAAMAFSSVAVVLNALRLRRWQPEREAT